MEYPSDEDFERAREEAAADPDAVTEDEDAAAMAHLPGTRIRRALAWLLHYIECEVAAGDEDWSEVLDWSPGTIAEWAWEGACFAYVDPNPRRGFWQTDVVAAATLLVVRPDAVEPLLLELARDWVAFVSFVPQGHVPGSSYRRPDLP